MSQLSREVKSDEDREPGESASVLKKKIQVVSFKIEQLESENEKLKERIGSNATLQMENEVLRRQVQELSEVLSRPAESANLIKELSEAKLLLADEAYETERVLQQVHEIRKKMMAKKKMWI
mmetsp:Transcript_309/g.1004  ORF Transcript_309/g.1004 Transcript_309/m.1004 type:complete len:122 (+) Transcript_309:1022-1387(+)